MRERIERNALRGAPMIWIRTSLAAAGLAVATAIPASAEIVASTCRLLSYDGPITTVETFRCDFMQRREVNPGGDAIALVEMTVAMTTSNGGIEKRMHRS